MEKLNRVGIFYSKRNPNSDYLMLCSTRPFKGAGCMFISNADLTQDEQRKEWLSEASEEDRELYYAYCRGEY